MSECKYSSTNEVEMLIKALGTMITVHDKKVHPETFEAYYVNPRNASILSDDNRKIVEEKLIELINKY